MPESKAMGMGGVASLSLEGSVFVPVPGRRRSEKALDGSGLACDLNFSRRLFFVQIGYTPLVQRSTAFVLETANTVRTWIKMMVGFRFELP